MGAPIDDKNRVSVEEAARRLGMSVDSLRQCIIQDKFPVQIGVAFKGKDAKNYTYYIYKRPLEKLEQIWGLVD